MLFSRTRRFVPQLILLLFLVVTCTVGTVGVAASLSMAKVTSPPAIIKWANEGTSDLLTLDPARGSDLNGRQAAQLIFGGLVRFGPRYTILPDAASHWSLSDHGRVYTFYLRPNVRFGDGTTLTVADIVFSLERVLSPPYAHLSGAYLLSDIAGASALSQGRAFHATGIRAINPRTLQIQLTRPTGSFLSKLATPAGYLTSRTRVERDPLHWAEHAIGTGPFLISRWIHNNGLLLVPNPYYWGGKLRIGGIDMPFIPEPLTAYKRYRAGAVDIVGTVSFPAQVLYEVRGESDFQSSPKLATVFLTLNERAVPLGSALVRAALARSIDKAFIVRKLYSGFAHPTNGMIPPGMPGYARTLPGTGYDPVRARRLLARAGFPGGRGLPTIVYAVDQDAQSLALAGALAGQWNHVLGVHIRLEQHRHADYLTLLEHRQYQIAVINWTADFPDPQNFLSQQLRTGSPNNNGGWNNRSFDRLVDRADSLPASNGVRLRLYHEAEVLAMDGAATIPLFNPSTGILLRGDIHGLDVSGGQMLARSWASVTARPGVSQ
jgi:oligopeptide transport system substrate-binding protein